jgi:hypothetical protein
MKWIGYTASDRSGESTPGAVMSPCS